MLLFTHHKKVVNPKKELLKIKENYRKEDFNYSLLIKVAEIESAVLEYININYDDINEVTSLLRELSIKTAQKDFSYYEELICKVIPMLPENDLTISIQEGFAYYAVYPEQYRRAVDKYFLENKNDVVVIGLRNIGTALSAVVSSELIRNNINVKSFTLRPRGEWYNRYQIFSQKLKTFIYENKNSNFLIVDEGPGKTGTSISGTIKELNKLGITFNNIIIFPSYYPDLSKLDEVWSKCKIYVQLFNPIEENKKYEKIEKIEGKNIFDKLKYKLHYNNDNYFCKFVGLGEYGIKAFDKAKIFYENDFSPEPLKLEDGFIYFKYIDNFLKKDYIVEDFLIFAAKYYSFLIKKFKTIPSHSFNELDEIISYNLNEKIQRKFEEQYAIEIDGLPELSSFCKIGNKFYKTGNNNYPLRHTLPGNIDYHYDLAAFIIENKLSKEQIKIFLNGVEAKKEEEKIIYYGLLYKAIKKAKEQNYQ